MRSLQPYYGTGDESRAITYREWVAVVMAEVRAGKPVCAVSCGHPGIFAWSPHEVIEAARAEGFPAWMEPAISAADCLYADLGIDPACRQVLVDVLSRDYPLNHEVIVYRGATLPIQPPRIRRVPLRDLSAAAISGEDMLIVPPASRLRHTRAIRGWLAVLAAQHSAAGTAAKDDTEPAAARSRGTS